MHCQRFPFVPLAVLLLAGCRPGSVWSPDGTRLAVEAKGALFLFEMAATRFEKLPSGPGKPLNPAWSPDGKRLCYYRVPLRNGEAAGAVLAVLDLAGRTERVLVPKIGLPEKPGGSELGANPAMLLKATLSTAWSPDGRRVVFITHEKGRSVLAVVPTAGGAPRSLTVPASEAFSPAWAPDGSLVAYLVEPRGKPGPAGIPASHGRIELHVIRPDGTGDRRLWVPPSGSDLNPVPLGPQWSRDSRSLGLVAEKTGAPGAGPPAGPTPGPAGEVWRVPLQGEARKVADVPGAAITTTVSPDLEWVLFYRATQKPQDPLVAALLAAPYREARTLFEIASPVPAAPPEAGPPDLDTLPIPVLSPDGKSVALLVDLAGKPAKLLLADTAGGKPREFEVP